MLEQIGKYRIESILGHGAMGIVYRGVDPSLERTVAIKTIHPHLLTGDIGEHLLLRFKTEATAAARCQHNNIVTVYEFGQHQDTPYIAMEFVKGRGLDEILKEQPSLPLKRINAIVLGICRGLHYAHQQGIVHRDIKPANIIVLDGDAIKIADFGIAKIPTSEMTQFGDALGTPSYMAPEQRDGTNIDQRADIFALGVVLFELLAGCSDILQPLRQHSVKAIRDLPPSKKLGHTQNFPKSIATFLDRCLSADAGQRFGTIALVVEAYKLAQQNMRASTDPDVTQVTRQAPLKVAPASADPDATQIAGQTTTEAPPVPEEEFIRKSSPVLEAMRALKVIDPVLNHDWNEKITRILDQLDESGRQRAYTNIIKPKNITWDAQASKFIFAGQPSLRDLNISLTTPQLASLAGKLAQSIDALKSTRNVMVIADTLEGGLSTIDRFNPEENPSRQKEKLKLRAAFLYDFAVNARQLDFDVPSNQRRLTIDAIKTYIVEVFIKQQLMGYWFATMPLQEVRKDSNPFVKTLIATEAKTRQFDVVQTDRYYFLIGSVPKFDQNQYSVRRFLSEDTAMNGKIVYFNILAVDKKQLTQPSDQEKIRYDISRMITIQRQLSIKIIELVDSFEINQNKYLLPLLFKPIAADGTNLETAIEQRLLDYEKNLCRLVFGKIPHGLKNLAKCQDDFEYLFFGLKSFLIELLGNVQDFSYQSSAQWSTKGQELEFRIASYLRLLEKRKTTVFTADSAALLDKDPSLDSSLPVIELKKIVDECEPTLEELTFKLREAIRQASEEQSKTQQMLTRIFKGGRQKIEPEKIRQDIDMTRKHCFLSIVRVPKRYPKITVYLEFEDLVQIDETVRHYAFPDGEDGLSLLPMLVRLPENKEEFDIKLIQKALEFDIFKSAQKWSTEAAGVVA